MKLNHTLLMKSLLVSLFVLGVWGLAGGDHDQNHDAGEKETDHHDEHGLLIEDAAKLGLTLVQPKRGNLSQAFSRPAEIQFDSKRIAHLKSGLGGFVREVHSEWGQKVRKDQVLVTLESRELGEAQAQLLAAEARFRLAEKTYNRETALWRDQITPEQDYLDALEKWENARIALRLARQGLAAVGFDERQTTLQADRGDSLTRYQLTAPFDGTIINQHVSQGEFLEAQDAVVTIVDPSVVWVVARVPETDIRRLAVDMPVRLSTAALPGRVFNGRCDYLAAELDKETRTLEVRAALNNRDGVLRAGMFGELTFMPAAGAADQWLLPTNALQRVGDQWQVYAAHDGRRFEALPVKRIASRADQVAVQGALSADMTIAAGDLFVLKSMAEKSAMGGHSH